LDEGNIGRGGLRVNQKYAIKKRSKIWAGVNRIKNAMRLKDCGVMQVLIWGVMSTGITVFERTSPVKH
jgi:hypothetical protein